MVVAETDDADQIEYETDEEDAEVLKVRAENEVLQSIIVSLEQQIESLSSQLGEAQQLVAVEKEVRCCCHCLYNAFFKINTCASIFTLYRIRKK